MGTALRMLCAKIRLLMPLGWMVSVVARLGVICLYWLKAARIFVQL